MKSRLDLIEGTIKSIFEGDYSLFPWMDEQSILIHKLIECVHENLIDLEGQTDTLPFFFTIYLNPDDYQFLQRQKNWQIAISKIISDLASELGFLQEQKPDIQITPRHSLAHGEMQMKVEAISTAPGRTNAVPLFETPAVAKSQALDLKACLMLEDESLFPLEKPVTNIGRKSINHLIVNDLRVSRTHAQIRKVGEDYIIFDIGSSGGTYINGERISQRKLKPGDVISLAGIKLIFTEDQAAKVEEKRQITSEIKPVANTGDN
jgi:hypothetical protein